MNLQFFSAALFIFFFTTTAASNSFSDCLNNNHCIDMELRVGSSNSFPPINFLSNNNQLRGFGRDISDAALSSLNITIKRHHSPIWTTVLDWLDKGDIDLIHDTGYTKDRDVYLDYSDPIISMAESIFVRENNVDINDLDSLKDKTVACINKHITHLYLQQFPDIKCHIVKRPIDGLTALLSGDADALVYPKEIILYFSQKQKLSNKIKIVGKPLRNLSWSMTVKQGNTQILSLINKGLRNIRKSGQYQSIYNKWFGVKVLSGYSRKEVVFILLAGVLITGFFTISIVLFVYYRKTYITKSQLESTVKHLETAQQALQFSDNRYREIAQNIPGCVYQLKLDNRGEYKFLYISEGIQTLTGFNNLAPSPKVKRFLAHIPKPFRQQTIQSIEDSARTMSPWLYEFPFKTLHDNTLWFRGSSVPNKKLNGDIVWNGIFINITELRTTKEERDNFFDLSLDLLCIANFDGYFVDLNSAWKKTLGYSLEELKSKPFIDFIHPDDVDITLAEAKRLALNETNIIGFENRYRCKNGEYRWLSWNALSAPETNKIYSVVQDITEQRMTALAIARAKDELELRVEERTQELKQEIQERKVIQEMYAKAKLDAEKANQAKSDFLSSMSHELRTPLNAILGFAQIIEMDTTAADENYLHSQEIIKGGNHLLNLINEILDLAKIESGKLSLSIEAVDWKLVIDECLLLVKPLANKKSIITYELHDTSFDYLIVADHLRIKQVTLNLLSNAVKYNFDGGNLTINISNNSDYWRMSVNDTGPGIPSDLQSRIFRPFDRLTQEYGNIEGTGIGLVIAKNLVEKMNGMIGFESEVGLGTTFWVDIPKATTYSSTSPTKGLHSMDIFSDTLFEHEAIILYIEDNPGNIALMEQIFKPHSKIKLIVATTPSDGLHLAKMEKPDLILLDINLPEMNGYQLKQKLDHAAEIKHTKVIAVSANAMDKDIAKSKSLGFIDYITKPINIQSLLTKVAAAIKAPTTNAETTI